jgi:hypothetical protein
VTGKRRQRLLRETTVIGGRTEKRHLLINETTEKHDYDRARALRVHQALTDEIAAGYWGNPQGYEPRESDSDDDRIIALFELLDGSIFGDWIFSSTDFDHGTVLREEDVE